MKLNVKSSHLMIGACTILAVVIMVTDVLPLTGAAGATNAEATQRTAVRAPHVNLAPDFGPRTLIQSAEKVEDAPHTGDDPESIRSTMHESFSMLWRRHQFVDSKEKEAEAFDDLLANPLARAEAVAIVSNIAHAESVYGEDQAVVRVYALKMLRHAAEQGERELIEQALEPLSQDLSAAETLRKGQREDYVSIVTSYMVALGDDDVLKDPKSFLESIGYSAKTDVEFHKAIYDSGIARRVPPAELQDVFGPYLAETSRENKESTRP
jgi:hypothetical protein